jgi:hypothetical protein
VSDRSNNITDQKIQGTVRKFELPLCFHGAVLTQRDKIIFKGRPSGNTSVTVDLQDMLTELVNLNSIVRLHCQEN